MNYESVVKRESQVVTGATFAIRRISLARRLALSKEIRELSTRMEFADGGGTFADKVEASVLALEIDRLYLQWGLESIHGITIDSEPATLQLLIERGPEQLCQEIVAAIRAECGLTEEERKN